MTSDGRYVLRRGTLPAISPDLLVDIVASACDLALVVSPQMIVESVLVNPQMGLGGKVAEWQGASLQDIFAPESWRKLSARLVETDSAPSAPSALELNHSDKTKFEFPIRYFISRTDRDGSFLMVGRDLRPLAEVQQQLVHAQLALERDYESQRELETRYRVLMEVSPVPIMIISMTSGRIVDLNSLATQLIGASRSDLVDAPIAQEFDGRRRGEFLESLANVSGAENAGPIELTVRRSKRRVQVRSTMFRAAGDKLLLCRIDLAESAKAQNDDMTEILGRLFHNGIDSIVFLDADGTIKAANESFLNLTDSPSLSHVAGRSFAEFLSRGSVDLRVLLDNVKRVGHLRHYATRLNTDYSGQVSVELSASYFQDRANPIIGLMIRDSSTSEGMRWPAGVPGNEGLRNVMELVGYSTLKDIVAETTEIIEKMCIETALELTGNNRVAAAELLSLSRQSLYVKLRKFGLLSKETD